MEKPTAVIYPFSKDDVQFFRYSNFITEFLPLYPVSPSGWSLAGLDVGVIDGGKELGITITDQLTEKLKMADILVLTSFERYIGRRGGYYEVLELAEKLKKPVIVTDRKEDNCSRFFWHPFNTQYDYLDNAEIYDEQTEVPVLAIMGEGPCTAKFEIQLALRNLLLNDGYKIAQIGTREYCELFGFVSYPSFMSSQVNEITKIQRFKRLVKQIEQTEDPDLIIVGIPGGVQPITEVMHNGYGVVHLEIGAAVRPDLVILSLYNNIHYPDYYERSARYLNYLIGSRMSSFVYSNTFLQPDDTNLSNKNYAITARNPLRFKKNTSNYPIYNLFETEMIYSTLMSQLHQNIVTGCG